MKETELKKLTRVQLLEILLAQSRELDRLRSELQGIHKKLTWKEERISEAESVAGASIALKSFLETAQAAADQYLWNVRRICEEKAFAAGKTEEWNAALAEMDPGQPAAAENTGKLRDLKL